MIKYVKKIAFIVFIYAIILIKSLWYCHFDEQTVENYKIKSGGYFETLQLPNTSARVKNLKV